MKFPQGMLNMADPLFSTASDCPHCSDPLHHAGELVLKGIGEDLHREGVARTPQRFAKAWRELTSGYQMTAREAVGQGIFPSEGAGLVAVKEIEFFSTCEHHMLPFWGSVSVAYYPQKEILGLSKIPRIVDVFAKRLQVQERLTREIAESITELVGARAVGVRAQGQHMCMMMRGVKKINSETITESFTGLESLSPEERARLERALS